MTQGQVQTSFLPLKDFGKCSCQFPSLCELWVYQAEINWSITTLVYSKDLVILLLFTSLKVVVSNVLYAGWNEKWHVWHQVLLD